MIDSKIKAIYFYWISLKQFCSSRLSSGSVEHFPKLILNWAPWAGCFSGMNEVAAVSKATESIIAKCATFLSFIFWIKIVVLLELMRAMCEFTVALVGAVTVLHVLSAELRFFFVAETVLRSVLGRIRLLCGERAGILLSCRWMLPLFSEHSSAEHRFQ